MMKKIVFYTAFTAAVLTLTFSTAIAQDKKEKKPQKEPGKSIADGEMKTYYMVFLNKGPKRNQDSATAAQIQKDHLAHLTKMADEGKMVIAGPFLDDGSTRGICIYDVATLEEAKQLAEADPAVKAGRLTVEVRPWMSKKGATLK
jgi:uncharacterized protein